MITLLTEYGTVTGALKINYCGMCDEKAVYKIQIRKKKPIFLCSECYGDLLRDIKDKESREIIKDLKDYYG
jgi:hypothetical protein